jgi:hypothetical protein
VRVREREGGRGVRKRKESVSAPLLSAIVIDEYSSAVGF